MDNQSQEEETAKHVPLPAIFTPDILDMFTLDELQQLVTIKYSLQHKPEITECRMYIKKRDEETTTAFTHRLNVLCSCIRKYLKFSARYEAVEDANMVYVRVRRTPETPKPPQD